MNSISQNSIANSGVSDIPNSPSATVLASSPDPASGPTTYFMPHESRRRRIETNRSPIARGVILRPSVRRELGKIDTNELPLTHQSIQPLPEPESAESNDPEMDSPIFAALLQETEDLRQEIEVLVSENDMLQATVRRLESNSDLVQRENQRLRVACHRGLSALRTVQALPVSMIPARHLATHMLAALQPGLAALALACTNEPRPVAEA